MLARPNGRRVVHNDPWTGVIVSVFLSVLVLLVSWGMDHGQSNRLDRLEKDNALQSQQIKTLGEKVSRQ